MRATRRDIPQLAHMWLAAKERSPFAQAKLGNYEDACCFLDTHINNPAYYIAVERTWRKVTHVCAVQLYPMFPPPHPLVVQEWLWAGETKRGRVRVYQEAVEWGKVLGAKYVLYSKDKRNEDPRKWSEVLHWRVL